MIVDRDDQIGIFAKLLSEMALYARDMASHLYQGQALASGSFDAMQLEFDDTDTTLGHPFICEKRSVSVCKPPIDVHAMVRDAAQCQLHTYVGSRPCRRQPVCDDGLLAAFALGGLGAIAYGKHPVGYSKNVQEYWGTYLDSFVETIVTHDKRLLEQALLGGTRTDREQKVVQSLVYGTVAVPGPPWPKDSTGTDLRAVAVAIRPNDPVRRRAARRKR